MTKMGIAEFGRILGQLTAAGYIVNNMFGPKTQSKMLNELWSILGQSVETTDNLEKDCNSLVQAYMLEVNLERTVELNIQPTQEKPSKN
jgi:hypothetical protein